MDAMDAMNTIKLTDKNGNDITAQQAYDAAMSGPVYAYKESRLAGNHSIEIFIALDLYSVIRENENVISIVFAGISDNATYYFYAGQNPNTIMGGGPR